MRRLYVLILPLMLVLAVQEVTAQANQGRFSIGADLHFQRNTTDNSPAFSSWIYMDPSIQYFYRQNRAIVGGFRLESNRNQYISYSHIYNTENVWQHRRIGRGAYVGLRQLHPLNEKFYIFTEFGVLYSRDKYQTEYVSSSLSPQYQGGNSSESHSIIGYGNLGLLYFINKKFSLETTFFKAKIDYNRPIDNDLDSKTWNFQLEGGNYVSLGLRYYF